MGTKNALISGVALTPNRTLLAAGGALLINNVGVIQVGPWNTMLRKDFEESIATHFWGPYNTMNWSLPDRGGIERQRVRGSKSESAWSPSVLTALNERAAVKNNEEG